MEISAHSGGCERGRPGTYEAYRSAVETGAEYVEFDIRRTADGELVVHHDAHTAQGAALAAIRYGRLCELAGFEVPRVAEVMRMIAGKARGHLDLKDADGEAGIVELALDILGPGNFIVTTLEDASVAAVKARFPSVPVALSLGRDLKALARRMWVRTRYSELLPMRRIRACGADWAALNKRLARAGVLSQCHRHGIKTMIWTVSDDRGIARWLADPRVSVLITDRPSRAVALRAHRAKTGPGSPG